MDTDEGTKRALRDRAHPLDSEATLPSISYLWLLIVFSIHICEVNCKLSHLDRGAMILQQQIPQDVWKLVKSCWNKVVPFEVSVLLYKCSVVFKSM